MSRKMKVTVITLMVVSLFVGATLAYAAQQWSQDDAPFAVRVYGPGGTGWIGPVTGYSSPLPAVPSGFWIDWTKPCEFGPGSSYAGIVDVWLKENPSTGMVDMYVRCLGSELRSTPTPAPTQGK